MFGVRRDRRVVRDLFFIFVITRRGKRYRRYECKLMREWRGLMHRLCRRMDGLCGRMDGLCSWVCRGREQVTLEVVGGVVEIRRRHNRLAHIELVYNGRRRGRESGEEGVALTIY